MNQNSVESNYYQMQMGNMDGGWAISESWLYLSSGEAVYQYKNAALLITSHLPDNTLKEDFVLDLTVGNAGDSKEVVSNLTSISYNAPIKSSDAKDNGLTLPQSGDNK